MSKVVKNSPLNITAIILSGGAGRRFLGADKGLQPYKKKPLIEHVIAAVQPQVSELILCVNRNQKDYQEFGFKLVSDNGAGYEGPLAGIVAALNTLHHSCDAVLISSCDSPMLPNDYVKTLETALATKRVAVVHDGQRKQNLHCLIRREAWASLHDFYQQGGRAMHRWHNKVSAIEVDFSDQADGFININSPEQLI